ncbi:type II secretory pathway protein [Sphingomonas sp. Leaf17]|uniref:type II secretion system minor pseudopilin GspK n=1 Tax=Sphingomonas sp. Leaf17 TaxID=1735683 RepID=UPI0006FDA811|nr:type II secretion system minor pseudopilin GspK [Sphingomonas sp. Leaf17]KQM63691.1 type II secretory pathway protein [Sphingomonas sp. Leaf17]
MSPERERGAALLTVLLLVAVIAVLAAGALEKLRLSTRLAGNAAGTEQARSYAMAAEVLATKKVDDLLGQAPDRVTLAGGWSGRPFGLPLPGGGVAVARVRDGGNCFNLNALVTVVPNTPGQYASRGEARAQFARLMRLLDVPAQVAEQVAAGAADWIDSDQDQQASGAEDARYLSQTIGYRTSGTLMADPSELRAVSGVTSDLYATLRPWICALPLAEMPTININTLSPEQAPLLAMLAPDTMTVAMARQALLARPEQGYADAGRFWAQPALASVQPGDVVRQTITTSTWFAMTIDVSLGDSAVQENALIDARRLPAQLVSRQWGEAS